MNKPLLLIIISLFSVPCAVMAQQTTESPYSFYGVGERNFGGIAEERAMGGIGVYADSTRVNIQNAATLSQLKYTAFSAGMTMQSKNIVTNETKVNARTSAFDYFSLGFPIVDNWGVAFGLLPYSSVGYKLSHTTNQKRYQYEGKGNVNQFFLSTGYQLYEGLSIGASLRYHFGAIDMNDLLQENNVQMYTQETSKSVLKGASFHLGLYYQQTLHHRLRLNTSLVFTPQSKLTSDNQRNISTLGYVSGQGNQRGAQLVVRETQAIDLAARGLKTTRLTLPMQIEAGVGIGEHQRWFAGIEYTYANTEKFANPFLTTTDVHYKDSYQLGIGGFWIPKYNSFTSYWNRVTYRVGFRYENTGIVLNGTTLNDFGTSFGLSLPVKGFSNLTTVFEYGRRGTLSANLIKENYFNFKIGFTLNDKWFQRTKYQ
ncbi:MAG: hypothetical protein ACTTJI_05360 [Capnocytophaga sp.]|uniref:hypothetical protein n=1 Tax=Capnocytophaga sp. TaxID=44737 RepID=UPI003F9F5181